MSHTKRHRKGTRLAAVAALALIIVAAWGSPAFAHAVLQGTTPGSGATVKRSPSEVTLTFDEPVGTSLGGVRMYNSSSSRVDVGNPTHSNGGKTVHVTTPHLSNGLYVVTWRVISADSHPVQGAFTFTVGNSNIAATDARSLANRLLTDQGGSTVVGVVFAIVRFGAFAGLTVLVGGALFLAWVWRKGRDDRRSRRLVWAGWWTTVGCTVAGFLLQGPYGGALPLSKVFDPSVWSEVWDTRFGKVYVLRVVLLLLAIPLLRLLFPQRGPEVEHPLPSWWFWVGGLLGLAICATPAAAGHASTGPLVAIATPADTLHVAGAAVWLGGVVLLFAGLMPRADEATLRDVVPRYSESALIAVGVIVATGVFQAFRQVNRFGALLDTDYGRLLLIKICVFLGLMVVAAVSRDIVNRRWRVPEDALVPAEPVGALAGAGTATAARRAAIGPRFGDFGERLPMDGGAGGDEPPELDIEEPEYPEGYILEEATAEKRLRRSLRLEVVLAVVILAVTALLVNAAPARELDTGPYVATLNTPKLTFDVTITPNSRGSNEMHLFTLNQQGLPEDVTEISAQLTQKANDIAPIPVKLIRLAPGHFTSANFAIPFAGDWTLTMKAVLGQVDEVSTSATVPVHS
jgi:copper transport protein